MRPKRGILKGFDGIDGSETHKRLKLWKKNSVELNWRTWGKERARYTFLRKEISYGENVFIDRTIVPFGMKESIKKRLSDRRGLNALSDEVKSELSLPANFDKAEVTIKVYDEGDKGYADFYAVFCRKCHSKKGYFEVFKKKYSSFLPQEPHLTDIWENWDKIVSQHPSEMTMSDIAACILPNDVSINAGPEGRKYVLRPTEHSNSKCHKWTSLPPTVSKESASGTSKKRSIDEGTPPTSQKKQKKLTVSSDGTLRAEKCVKAVDNRNGDTVDITIRHGKSLTCKPVKDLLDPTVGLKKEPSNKLERIAQNSCFSFVLSGCAKEVSNEATLEFYKKHVQHLRSYHQQTVGNYRVDNKCFPLPLRAELDKNNIKNVHTALCNAYKVMPTSSGDINKLLYKPFKEENFFSIYTDGIQKFGRELNGAYARTATSNLEITNAPISLHEIEGGSLDQVKLAEEMLTVINNIKPIPSLEAANSSFRRSIILTGSDVLSFDIPSYFKCCTVVSQDN